LTCNKNKFVFIEIHQFSDTRLPELCCCTLSFENTRWAKRLLYTNALFSNFFKILKTMKKHIFVLLVPLLLLAIACCKTPEPVPEPDLPPETQTGAGTIGCYINGKPWWPKPYFAVGVDPYFEVLYGGFNPETFYLSALIPTSKGIGAGSLEINIFPLAKKGDNKIWYDPRERYIFKSYDTTMFEGNCGQFRLDTLRPRRLTITKLDTSGIDIISGTFEFTAYNPCGDTLRFTKGRFDY
jgi:hypothetical protein